MSNNEETLYGEVKFNMENKNSSEGHLWKKVGFGSLAGILLGAGALYGYDQYQNASHGTSTTTADNNHSDVVDDGQNDSNTQNSGNEQQDTTPDHHNIAQYASTSHGHAASSGAHHAGAGANVYAHHVVDLDDPNAVIYEEAPVADVSDELTFEDAFNLARAEVGPGGVFVWHGGIYSTYNEAEWNAMSEAQHTEYAQSIDVEVGPDDIPVDILEEHPEYMITVVVTDGDGKEVAVISDALGEDPDLVLFDDDGNPYYVNDMGVGAEDEDEDENQAASDDGGEDVVENATYDDGDDVVQAETGDGPFIESEDVVEYGTVEGHQAVTIDMTDDGEADVMVVDVDDSYDLSEPDVMVFENGDITTVGDFVEEVEAAAQEEVVDDPVPGGDILASMENPDVAPDMPDYMDDANILA